jgi:hypothetical protein
VEFLAISIFHEIRIPMVDMKVYVCSKFRKKNFKKSKISNLHEDWNIFFEGQPSKKVLKKLKIAYSTTRLKCQSVAGGRPRAATWEGPAAQLFWGFFFLPCPPLYPQVVNSCWLSPAHGCPPQPLPKNFKHP